MAKNKNSDSSKEKDEKDEDVDSAAEDNTDEDPEEEDADNTDADEEDEGDPDDEDSEEEDDESDSDIDLDAEIEAEKERGKPDSAKAHKRIKDKNAEAEDEEEEDEDDKPLSRREANKLLADQKKEAQELRAFDLAKRLVGGGKNAEKETELVVLKWKNRSFPEGMLLSEQVEEAYAITFRKKLISQKNEAFRALKHKDGVNRNSAGAHRGSQSSPSKNAPNMSKQDRAAIETSFGPWNPVTKRFEKKLRNGNLLVKYPGKEQPETIKAK